MNIASAIVIYVIVWWSVFFAILPMGVRGRWEADPDGVKGAEPGAPVEPNLKKKAILTSLISAGIWAVVVAIILSGTINFKE